MQYTIFDIETTGLSPRSSAIVQFAYITCDSRLFPIRGRNYYFYKEGMPWSKEAEAVHGLSQEFLSQYKDQYDENLIHMYQVVHRATLVGHNSDAFDVPFVRQFLAGEGMEMPVPTQCYDTMKLWTKDYGRKPKLGALLSFLELDEDAIIRTAQLMFGADAGDLKAHNACYDVALTLACFRKAVEEGKCSLSSAMAPPVSVDLY